MEINDSAYLAFESFEGTVRQYMAQMQLYDAAIKEIKTKLEILDNEFSVKYDHNPIHNIKSRLKSPRSILEKLNRRSLPLCMDSLKEGMNDIAGIRVICNYLDDIYHIADLLTGQDDVKLLLRRDYIKHPKQSGYRSLHLVIEIPVFLAERVEQVKCEVQIRTIAMDFWASLEHKLKYKSVNEIPDELLNRLRLCAEAITEVDVEMQEIHKDISKERTEGE
ncbi:MAG: GTP pyrophosphokinase family protein [Clostridia bacterium]|nr:GTP pyrophosphokinase family protein [Clostridia bacterium]